MKKKYKDENINHTIIVDGNPYIEPKLSIVNDIYPLDKYEFDKLVNGKTSLNRITEILLGVCIGYFLNMLGKLIGNKIDPNIPFDNWEIFAFSGAFGLFILIAIVDYFISSKHKEIKKKIKEHLKI